MDRTAVGNRLEENDRAARSSGTDGLVLALGLVGAIVEKGLVSAEDILRQLVPARCAESEGDAEGHVSGALQKRLCPLQAFAHLPCQSLLHLKEEVKDLLDGLKATAGPVVTELVEMHRRIHNGIGVNNPQQADLLRGLLDVVEERVRRLRAELILPKVGDLFDPGEHESVGTTATTDRRKHRRITAVAGAGFRWRDNGVSGLKAQVQVSVCREGTGEEEKACQAPRGE